MLRIVSVFLVATVLNLAYELLHSWLYKTCREASLKKYSYLMVKACLFDGIAITIIYYFSILFFKNFYLLAFATITLAFAYVWEIHSLKKGKWEYAKEMPIVFGVGLTPLAQLFLTGIATLYLCQVF